MIRLRILQVYYAVTPLYLFADLFLGMNIRVVGLEGHPAMRFGYYGICTAAGAVTFWKPSLTHVWSLTESTANILTLILGIMLPIYGMVDQAAMNMEITHVITTRTVVNFVSSGTAALIAFYNNPLVTPLGKGPQ